jgi:hypothetical protein
VAKEQTAEEMLIEDMAGFSQDPLGFVLYSFAWGKGELSDFVDGPDEWQRKELEEIGEQLRAGASVGCVIQRAIASGHGIGKSCLVSWLILWALATFEDTRGVVTANTENQLKTKTWSELAKWFRLFIARHWFCYTATAIFAADKSHEKTWRIDMVAWSERNTEAFAGLHNQGKRILIIFDEGSAIPDVIYEVSEGACSDKDTEILWFVYGNPTRNVGRFKELFSSKRWVARQIDSRTARMTNKTIIEQQIEEYGIDSDFIKVRVRGMFPATSAKQFYSTPDIDAAFGRHLRPEQYNFAPKILTCDPAWEGDDELVIGLRQGLTFRILRVIPYNDNDIEVAGLLAQHEDDEKADAVFVDAGYGTGIVSAGRTWGRSWTLVWFGGKSTNPGCLNKRAEMALEAKKWLKAGGSIPDDKKMYNELATIETVPRSDGVIQLESKKDMKARKLPSPGRFDSWILSFAHPVIKKIGGHSPLDMQDNNHESEYDPLA